jgi:hypothetical protein
MPLELQSAFSMRRVATSIEIATPPALVFDVLTDFAAYAEWNPFFSTVRGRAEVGSPLEFEVKGAQGKGRTLRAVLTELAPGVRVVWRGGMMLGLFRSEHCFELLKSAAGCVVLDVESFAGPLVTFLINDERIEQQRQGFTVFDQALKARCEHLIEAAA